MRGQVSSRQRSASQHFLVTAKLAWQTFSTSSYNTLLHCAQEEESLEDRSGISAEMQREGDEAAALRLLPTQGTLCVHSVLGFRAMWSHSQPKGTELHLRHPLQPQSKLAV